MDHYALMLYHWALRRRSTVQLSGELEKGKSIGSLKVDLLGEAALYSWNEDGSVLDVRDIRDMSNVLGTCVQNPRTSRQFRKALLRLGYGG